MHLLTPLALAASASAAVIPKTVHTVPRQDAAVNEGYVFAYFTNSSLEGENIFLAASKGNNALDWQELNGGKPILTSSEGTKGLRDPFLIRVCILGLLSRDALADIDLVSRWRFVLPDSHRPIHRLRHLMGRSSAQRQPIPQHLGVERPANMV